AGKVASGVARHIVRLDAAANLGTSGTELVRVPRTMVAIVASAAAGIAQVDRGTAHQVVAAIDRVVGRTTRQRFAIGADPRLVGLVWVVVHRVVHVGPILPVRTDAVLGHGVERHRARVVQDEEDVRRHARAGGERVGGDVDAGAGGPGDHHREEGRGRGPPATLGGARAVVH